MSVLKERVAYLKKLADDLNVDENDDHSKLLSSIIDTLDEFADEIERLGSFQMKMQEQVDIIDEDLGVLEEEVFEGYEEDLLEACCPHCEEIVSFSEDEITEDDNVECPACHKMFVIEWESDHEDMTDK